MNHMTKTYKKQLYPAGHGKAKMLPLGGFAHERAAFIMIHAKLHMLQKCFKNHSKSLQILILYDVSTCGSIY